jgi:hypothetical protein
MMLDIGNLEKFINYAINHPHLTSAHPARHSFTISGKAISEIGATRPFFIAKSFTSIQYSRLMSSSRAILRICSSLSRVSITVRGSYLNMVMPYPVFVMSQAAVPSNTSMFAINTGLLLTSAVINIP